MNDYKLKRPLALIAGICLILGNIMWFVFSSLPLGYVNIISTFRALFNSGSLLDFADSLLWILVFFSWIFAAVALFIGKDKICRTAFLVFGGIFLLDNIFVMFSYYFRAVNVLTLITPVSLILTGLAIQNRNRSYALSAMICAAAGFISEGLIYQVLNFRQMMAMYADDYILEAPFIGRLIMVLCADLFLMVGIILTNFAAGTVGSRQNLAAYGPYGVQNTGQSQPMYGSYGQTSYDPYSGQYYGDPNQPYGYGQQPYRGGQNGNPIAADAPSFGFGLLGFFVPLAGLILYLIWKDQTPLKAASAGKGALIGVIVSVSISILSIVLLFIAGAALQY